MSSPLSFHGSFQFLTPQLPDHFGSPEVTTNEFSLPSSPSSPDHSSSTLSPSTETCELSTSSAPTRPRRSGSAIPRPRNAFIIFRSEFYQGKIKNTVERDHRHVSRILGHIWAQLPKEEKDEWKRKAEAEKAAHLKKYPGYRFSPTPRAGKPLKRNVNRNGTEDMMRCRQVAAFILAGKEGDDLEVAVKDIDSVMPPPAKKTRAKKAKRPTPAAKTSSSRSAKASGSMVASPSTPVQGWIPAGDSTEQAVDLAFRSPLLPPTKMLQEEYLGPVCLFLQPSYV
ncbi:hypothetical protein C8J56DRAFT_298696 [Mycena floridula]|nr:hypothetical protein C8J56DRAFT_298696 [Mycena floridula]